jgi:elongation factor 1-alpha
MTEKPLRLPI